MTKTIEEVKTKFETNEKLLQDNPTSLIAPTNSIAAVSAQSLKINSVVNLILILFTANSIIQTRIN